MTATGFLQGVGVGVSKLVFYAQSTGAVIPGGGGGGGGHFCVHQPIAMGRTARTQNNSDTDKRTPESQAASLPPVWFITRSPQNYQVSHIQTKSTPFLEIRSLCHHKAEAEPFSFHAQQEADCTGY